MKAKLMSFTLKVETSDHHKCFRAKRRSEYYNGVRVYGVCAKHVESFIRDAKAATGARSIEVGQRWNRFTFTFDADVHGVKSALGVARWFVKLNFEEVTSTGCKVCSSGRGGW